VRTAAGYVGSVGFICLRVVLVVWWSLAMWLGVPGCSRLACYESALQQPWVNRSLFALQRHN